MSRQWREPERLGLCTNTELGRLVHASKVDAPTDDALRRMESSLLASIGAGGASDGGAPGDTALGGGGAEAMGTAGAGGATGAGVSAVTTVSKLVGTLAISALVGASAVTLIGPVLSRAPRPAASAATEASGVASRPLGDGPRPATPLAPLATSLSDLADVPTPRAAASSASSNPRGAESVRAPIAPFPEAPVQVDETEAAMLARAQDALAASPSVALRLCDEHAARFPRGMLGQEREVIAIEALVRMGRIPEARVRAATFRKLFPRSAHLARIDRLVPAP